MTLTFTQTRGTVTTCYDTDRVMKALHDLLGVVYARSHVCDWTDDLLQPWASVKAWCDAQPTLQPTKEERASAELYEALVGEPLRELRMDTWKGNPINVELLDSKESLHTLLDWLWHNVRPHDWQDFDLLPKYLEVNDWLGWHSEHDYDRCGTRRFAPYKPKRTDWREGF